MPTDMQKRFALFVGWYLKHEVLVEITPLQVEFCDFLQFGYGDPSQDRLAMAYRGMGKTTIIKLFQLWYLSQYPFEQVLFIGNSPAAAKACGSAMLSILESIPFFEDLRIGLHDNMKKNYSQVEFNVKGKIPTAGSSWRGLTYGTREMTGLRASLMVLDDWESKVEANSAAALTQQVRVAEELYNIQSEVKPHWCKIGVGTFHSEFGIWSKLSSGDFNLPIRLYPVLYPDLKKDTPEYLKNVSPWIMKRLRKDPSLAGKATDRLGARAMSKKPGGVNSSNFRLNYMMDNSGGDICPYPLKCSDLIVMKLDPSRLPTNLVWGTIAPARIDYLRCPGRGTDAFFGPREGYKLEFAPPDTSPQMYCDSAGCGRDEMAWIIATACKGKIFILDIGAYRANESETRSQDTINACKKHGVQLLHVEQNNNHSIVEVMNSLARSSDCRLLVKGIHTYRKKENRILNTMSELLAQHRLVIDTSVIDKDRILSKGDEERQLFYQLAHAKDAPSLGLKFDDRIDALAGVIDMLRQHVEWSDAPQLRSDIEAMAKYQQRVLDGFNGELTPNSYGSSSLDLLMQNSDYASPYSYI